jgi:hypothetical protein
MKTKAIPFPRFVPLDICRKLILLAVLVMTSLGFAPLSDEGYWARQLRLYGKMNLPVAVILQSKYTSCGPAVIAMAYKYAYPETRVNETRIIGYAAREEYYTESKPPFTSPENMVRIAEHYAAEDTVSSGVVETAEDGLKLLTKKLTAGEPVIIDVTSRLYDLDSGAHFVLVTGITLDDNPNKVKLYFNDPLTGTNRWGYWLGGEGVWNAWKNNGDPGGAGWWMVISSP